MEWHRKGRRGKLVHRHSVGSNRCLRMDNHLFGIVWNVGLSNGKQTGMIETVFI